MPLVAQRIVNVFDHAAVHTNAQRDELGVHVPPVLVDKLLEESAADAADGVIYDERMRIKNWLARKYGPRAAHAILTSEHADAYILQPGDPSKDRFTVSYEEYAFAKRYGKDLGRKLFMVYDRNPSALTDVEKAQKRRDHLTEKEQMYVKDTDDALQAMQNLVNAFASPPVFPYMPERRTQFVPDNEPREIRRGQSVTIDLYLWPPRSTAQMTNFTVRWYVSVAGTADRRVIETQALTLTLDDIQTTSTVTAVATFKVGGGHGSDKEEVTQTPIEIVVRAMCRRCRRDIVVGVDDLDDDWACMWRLKRKPDDLPIDLEPRSFTLRWHLDELVKRNPDFRADVDRATQAVLQGSNAGAPKNRTWWAVVAFIAKRHWSALAQQEPDKVILYNTLADIAGRILLALGVTNLNLGNHAIHYKYKHDIIAPPRDTVGEEDYTNKVSLFFGGQSAHISLGGGHSVDTPMPDLLGGGSGRASVIRGPIEQQMLEWLQEYRRLEADPLAPDAQKQVLRDAYNELFDTDRLYV